MKIIITVYRKDEDDMMPYEKAEASNFLDAEAELARIGRHWEKDMLLVRDVIEEGKSFGEPVFNPQGDRGPGDEDRPNEILES